MSIHDDIIDIMLMNGAHPEFAALEREKLIRLMFLNYRKSNGGRGLKLSKTGLEIMMAHFQPYIVELEEGARFNNMDLVILDRECIMPYFLEPARITLFEKETAVILKLSGGNVKLLKDMERTAK